MLMRENPQRRIESVAANAIRSVERQHFQLKMRESSHEKALKKSFFELLNNFSFAIFSGVDRAANQGEREFFLMTIPGFAEQCNSIFGAGASGSFSVKLLNQWIASQDLKHLFHAEGTAIHW